jgi:hypothetical protein
MGLLTRSSDTASAHPKKWFDMATVGLSYRDNKPKRCGDEDLRKKIRNQPTQSYACRVPCVIGRFLWR